MCWITDGLRPEFWEVVWERYVENKLAKKLCKANGDKLELTAGDCCSGWSPWRSRFVQANRLREVFAQQYKVEEDGKIEPVKVHATGVVQNPHDPQAEWLAKGQGKQKKEEQYTV